MNCLLSGLVGALALLWGLWVWLLNDTTMNPLSTALICIGGLCCVVCALRAHYGETK